MKKLTTSLFVLLLILATLLASCQNSTGTPSVTDDMTDSTTEALMSDTSSPETAAQTEVITESIETTSPPVVTTLPPETTAPVVTTVIPVENSSERIGWLIDEIPAYVGGTKSKALYKCGQGYTTDSFGTKKDSLMQLISSTTSNQFANYLDKLTVMGYKQDFYNTCENNIYASYFNGTNRIYTYFTGATKTARVILDMSSECSATDFGYTYEKKAGDTTVVYQYGVPMNEAGVNIKNNSEKKIDCGMMYVIKLADNSVVIIDGGGCQQFDTAEIDGLMSFLQSITGVNATDKIRIAGWYITHCHSDHMAGFCLFIKKYSSRIDVERIFFNFPTVYSNDSILSEHGSNYSKLIWYIKNCLKSSDITYLKIHTGETINLADVSFQVLFTHEDIVNSTTAATEISGDFNNSCTVMKISFDSKTFMMLGDIDREAMSVIINYYTSTTLKSDIVQLAHHVINNVSELYNIIKAPVMFVPQSPNGATIYNRQTTFDVAKQYVKNNMYYYANKGTYGLSVVNGSLSLTFTDKVYGGAYITEWGW